MKNTTTEQKEAYNFGFYWGAFAVCYSQALIFLFMSFAVFPLSLKFVSLINLILGIAVLYMLKTKKKNKK